MIVIMMVVVMTITMVILSSAWKNDDDDDYHDTSTSGRTDQSKQPARDDTQRAQLGSAGIIFQRYM